MLCDQTGDAPAVHGSARRTHGVPRRSGRASGARQSGTEGRVAGSRVPREPSVAALLPIMGVVLVAFLVIGFALPVLPLHLHRDLGSSTFVVGLVTGSQFG